MRLLSLCRMRRVWLFWLHRQQSSRVPAAHAHSLGFRASLWLWTGLLHAHEWISRARQHPGLFGQDAFRNPGAWRVDSIRGAANDSVSLISFLHFGQITSQYAQSKLQNLSGWQPLTT